jgi:hypothetical protein
VRPSSLGTISWLGSLCSSNLCRRCGNCARGGAIRGLGSRVSEQPWAHWHGPDVWGVRLRSARWPLVRVGH